ncbi:MAG: D-alanyl-D-alanine carboxypeptidase/D-alanyl-D-alanine-endopeptidase [Bacteroidota bacterium]
MIRTLIGALAAGVLGITVGMAQEPSAPIHSALKKVLAAPDMAHASLGVYAVMVDNDSVIIAHEADRSLVPASTMKIVTTAAALEILGDSMRFRTDVEYSGRLDGNRVLQGHIYIRGGGDPTLGSRFFEQDYREPIAAIEDWADSIASLGFDSINGAVIGDAQLYDFEMVPSTWIWGDMGNYYGAGTSGLTVNDNSSKLVFATGPVSGRPSKLLRTHPHVPGMTVENHVRGTDVDHDDAYVYGAPYNFERYATGEIPKGRSAFEVKASIPDPALLTAQLLEAALRERGIGLSAPATTVRREKLARTYWAPERARITTTFSPPLREIVYWVNMKSVNLFAEHLQVAAGLKLEGVGSSAVGSAAIEAFWQRKGIGKRGLYVNDGSGLSRFNGITPRQMTDMLVYMTGSDHFEAFEASLPVSGRSGTLKGIGKGTPAENNLRAKSGTMTRVKSYAGYVHSRSGKRIAFSMILNNCDCSSYRALIKLQRLMVALANTP